MDIKKIIAKLPVGYLEDSASMDGDALRAEIIKAETTLREVDLSQKNDEKLSGAREIVKDLVSSYNEAKRAQRAKIAYTLHLLEERGELGTGEFAGDAVTKETRPGLSKKDGAKKSRAA
jgi:hypothetical protein